jgi:hypothetical protein
MPGLHIHWPFPVLHSCSARALRPHCCSYPSSPAVTLLQKPSDAELQLLVGPVGALMMAASELSAGNRSPYVNHMKVVGEAMQALSWVVYTGPASGAYCAWGRNGWEGGEVLVERMCTCARCMCAGVCAGSVSCSSN